MSSSENSYVNLAQQANQIGPFRETLLGVLGIVYIGNNRVNIDAILNRTPSQVVQAGLETNGQVLGLLGKVGKDVESANDSSSLANAA
ncbi:hypothetical protein KBC86_03925 [Candidatus Gracilibacteria bacterium]|nr:hypothetical protein [Candidatus Gracilibacteria bacterium]